MMELKRVLCLMLSLSLLFSLAACGGGSGEGNKEPAPARQSAPVSPEGQWLGKGGCYALDGLSEGDWSAMKGSPERLIYRSEMYDRLYNGEGSLLYDGYAYDYAVTEDGVWCVRAVGVVDGVYVDDCYAVKLGFDGQELTRFDISGKADSLAVTGQGLFVYDAWGKLLRVYDAEGTELGRIDLAGAELEDFSGSLEAGGDGSVWLLSDVQRGLILYPVELSTMSLGPAYTLPEDTVSLNAGTAERPFLLSTGEALMYLDPRSGSTENILYWEECGISGVELGSFIPDGDGFLCLAVTGPARLRPAQPGEIRPKTRLTLGTVFKYDGSELAARFNAMSGDYIVEIVDYSDDGALSPEDAQMKLYTELISGQGPDMVLSSGRSSSHSAALFSDLYPLLDADPELGREDLYGLTALENGGRLLLAPCFLSISTFGALPEAVGDRSGWTWDEYFALESKLPPDGVMSSYLSGDFFLQNSLELYAPHAIDWVNGTCDFDTPEFVRILTAAKQGYDPDCPVENPYFIDEVRAMMAEGRMILTGATICDAASFAQNESMIGRELSYIGWPTPDGSCGSVFHVSGVSISAATDCMEGCWQFARYVLMSTFAYKPCFEKAMAEAVAADGDDPWSGRLTQSQVDRYRELLASVTVAVTDSSEICDIVLGEAAAMFAGDKTPEETAKLIQSKLSIYVAEHM